MTSVSKRIPSTPLQAAGQRAALDRRLDTGLFKAIGDPTRAKLLACLVKCGRPCSVSEVAACCSVDFSVVARHLALLARAGVLEADKRGRTVWYQARRDELAARLRALADAIDEWRTPGGWGACSEDDRAGDTCCVETPRREPAGEPDGLGNTTTPSADGG